MKRPEEIAVDVRRERIAEAIRSIVHTGGRLSAGRIARDARVDRDVVVALMPTFSPDEIVGLVEDEPERELAAAA